MARTIKSRGGNVTLNGGVSAPGGGGAVVLNGGASTQHGPAGHVTLRTPLVNDMEAKVREIIPEAVLVEVSVLSQSITVLVRHNGPPAREIRDRWRRRRQTTRPDVLSYYTLLVSTVDDNEVAQILLLEEP